MGTKITYGMIGILSLIVAALGGTIFLTEDQLEDSYICSINQNIVIADRLSSTGKTAYWIDENNETQSKVCRNGYWLNLKQYAEDNNIEINILLQENLIQESNNESSNNLNKKIEYRCNSRECVEILE